MRKTPKTPPISPAEWKVMQVLWRESPQAACEIAQAICPREAWEPRTVKTLLARLIKKGALTFDSYKNLYLYRPLVSEEECVRSKIDAFVQQVFGGSLSMLLVHFSKDGKLSEAEVKELKRLVKKMES